MDGAPAGLPGEFEGGRYVVAPESRRRLARPFRSRAPATRCGRPGLPGNRNLSSWIIREGLALEYSRP